MVGGINEILGRKDKIILGTMLAFLFCLIFILNELGYFEDKQRDNVLGEEFKTTIIGKYLNRQEHMTSMLKLSNGNEMINYFPKHKIELMIGDSLVKNKNSTNMDVYRERKLKFSINLLEK